jgi:ribosomal protein L37E
VTDTASLLLSLSAAAFVISAAALGYALRGRRVDDHPVCRRCGFDLYGKPDGATRCSECGADLSRQRAVRVGRRETRRGLLKASAPLLLVSVGLLGVQGWGRARGVDWNHHKPTWWLMREAEAPDAATRDAALAELTRRIGDGSLERGREEALVQKAIVHQSDWNQPWVPGWGAVVEATRKARRLSDERWEQYLTLAVPYTLVPAQPAYRRAHELGLRLMVGTPRLAKARLSRVDLYAHEIFVTNGQRHRAMMPGYRQDLPPLRSVQAFSGRPGLGRLYDASAWARIDEPAIAQLSEGRQATRMSIVLAPSGSAAPAGSARLPPGAVTRELEAT